LRGEAEAALRGEAEAALRGEAEAALRGEAEATLRGEAEAASQAEAARATKARGKAWVSAALPPPLRAGELLVQPRIAPAHLTEARQHGKQPLVWAPWGWDRRTSRRADS
jgi:hypothetical protein